jgi:hypothetical protein
MGWVALLVKTAKYGPWSSDRLRRNFQPVTNSAVSFPTHPDFCRSRDETPPLIVPIFSLSIGRVC